MLPTPPVLARCIIASAVSYICTLPGAPAAAITVPIEQA